MRNTTTALAVRQAVLERMQREDRLTPENLVHDAADPEHPLHEDFTWDDAEAAQQYRLDQARSLIRSVRYIREVREVTLEIPVFVRDVHKRPDEQGYILTEDAMKDRAHETLQRELAVAAGVLKRTIAVAEGLELHEDVADLMKILRLLSKKLD